MDTRSEGSATLIAPRTVQVRALTYNTPDTYGTSWKPGVFNASLSVTRTSPLPSPPAGSRRAAPLVPRRPTSPPMP